MSEITDRLSNLSPEEQRALLAQLLQEEAPKPQMTPLSFSQERIWFLEQLAPGSTANIVHFVRLAGRFDMASLRQTLNEIVRRHESLRTTFATVDGRPVQLINPPEPLFLSLVDLRYLPLAAREAEVQRLAIAESRRGVDLVRGPLFRARLLWSDDDEYFLLLSFHHSIFDGWSSSVFAREVATLYPAFSEGRPSPLPDLPVQYADFVHWQRERLQGEVLEQQLSYWKQQLGGAPAVLELPTDRPRSASPGPRGGSQRLTLPRPLVEKLKVLNRQEGITLFITLLAALKVLLCRYTGQKDISVGTYIANRNFSQIEGLIGFFTNTLVLRTDLSGNPTFRELLKRVSEVTLEAHAHQDLPFEKLLEELRPARRLDRTPFFQVMLVLQNWPGLAIELPGLAVQMLPALEEEETSGSDADLILLLQDTDEGLRGRVGYDASLFDATTIRRMWDNWHTLLTGLVENPDERIAALPLMTAKERDRLVLGLNQTQASYPAEATIQELFAAQVERSPDAVAVSFAGKTLTCAELNARANQVAHYLRKCGVGPDVIVGVTMTRSLEMIVALLGVLKAGGAYLPLDPTYPMERLDLMVRDAQVETVLTEEHIVADSLARDAPVHIIALDGAVRAAIAQESSDDPESVTLPDHLAYVIYTSGSTGLPKGVMVSQRALVQYVTAGIDHFAVTPDDRVLQFASISFDAAAEEIYPSLLSGATLVLRTDAMLDSIETFLQTCTTESITVLDLPTAYWHVITTELEANSLEFPPSLRLVILGGEAALPERLQVWQTHAPAHIRLVNTYGPTETTIVATMCDLTGKDAPESATRAPIGGPIANTRVYVLDLHLQPVPVGVPGELYIGGDGLARGYLNRPGLTAKLFIPDPFGGLAGARLYKTGDLVRYLPDGNLEFLERADRQVKIRGFRVEPGEIESVLNQHPAVRQTVVLAHKRNETTPGDKWLVAYVVPGEAQADDLRRFLRQQLPDYMIPSTFVPLDALPLTPSGKVDRHALLVPDVSWRGLEEFAPPETPLEEELAQIWAKILGVEQIGIFDNFFDLGGHSLMATQVIHRINETFEVNLTLRNLFEEPTIADLALLIEETLIAEL